MTAIQTYRARLPQLADWLAISLAVSLPWSTSLTGILAALWVITVLQVLTPEDYRRVFSIPAGYLPATLVAAGALGLIWATVSWPERWDGLNSYFRLLCIPLLFAQFSRSDRAPQVMVGFALSCVLLLTVSWLNYLFNFPFAFRTTGIPVKDYIAQSAMLTVALLFFVRLSVDQWRAGKPRAATALMLLAAACLVNIFYVATSRTSLVVTTLLLLLFGFRQFGWRGAVAMLAAFVILVAAAWPTAGYLRLRVVSFFEEVEAYKPDGKATSAGERLEFWRKSISFIKEAPVLGHGTGSIRQQFEQSAVGQTGLAASVAHNPHNQLFAVGIQIGGLGIAILIMMWLAQLVIFNSASMASWMGLVVLLQNIGGSMFNSHIFDFTHGWLYVVGVGVAGGTVIREAARAKAAGTV